MPVHWLSCTINTTGCFGARESAVDQSPIIPQCMHLEDGRDVRRWSAASELRLSKFPQRFKSRWRTPLAESMFPTVVIIPQRLYWPNWAFEMRKVSLAASYNLAEVVQGRGCAQLSVNHPVHPGEISSLRTTQTFSNLGIFACKHSVPEI